MIRTFDGLLNLEIIVLRGWQHLWLNDMPELAAEGKKDEVPEQ